MKSRLFRVAGTFASGSCRLMVTDECFNNAAQGRLNGVGKGSDIQELGVVSQIPSLNKQIGRVYTYSLAKYVPVQDAQRGASAHEVLDVLNCKACSFRQHLVCNTMTLNFISNNFRGVRQITLRAGQTSLRCTEVH